MRLSLSLVEHIPVRAIVLCSGPGDGTGSDLGEHGFGDTGNPDGNGEVTANDPCSIPSAHHHYALPWGLLAAGNGRGDGPAGTIHGGGSIW